MKTALDRSNLCPTGLARLIVTLTASLKQLPIDFMDLFASIFHLSQLASDHMLVAKNIRTLLLP